MTLTCGTGHSAATLPIQEGKLLGEGIRTDKTDNLSQIYYRK